MFREDLRKHWEDGLAIFLKDYDSCGYKFQPSGAPCTVRGRENHKRHIHSSEPRLDRPSKSQEMAGDFQPRRLWKPEQKAQWLEGLEQAFTDVYLLAFQDADGGNPAELIRDHRRGGHERHHEVWKAIKSNKTCLACLQSVPDHVLACGHSYCGRCVQDLVGTPSRSYESAFELSECVLCGGGSRSTPKKVRLKPRCAGVRLLSLDGGGVRGIVELGVLLAIQKDIGLEVPIGELFDLVVGTSTGKRREGPFPPRGTILPANLSSYPSQAASWPSLSVRAANP